MNCSQQYGPVSFDYAEAHHHEGMAWFPSLIIMLVGVTIVCRWMFRSGAPRVRPTQLRGASLQAAAVRSSAKPQPPPIPTRPLSRMCSRMDCGRMNPPMARFCRRCGAALDDA